MALTGLVLVGFVFGHLLGNLLMFKGPAALNEYAKWLHDHPGLIWTARTVLLISVFAHIWVGIKLSLEIRPPGRVVPRSTPPVGRPSAPVPCPTPGS